MLRTPRRRRTPALIVVAVFVFGALGFAAFQAYVSTFRNAVVEPAKTSVLTESKPGVALNDPRAFAGYTLFAPLRSTETYLIDMEGRVVHSWQSDCGPGLGAYLLDNGHLLRPGVLHDYPLGFTPGVGGRIQEYTWDGELVWDYKWPGGKQLPHHDVCRLPNGNVLMILSEKKTADEVSAAGRKRESMGETYMLPDCLIEVKPTGKTTGAVVWEWHLWDHLIQDHDSARATYGNVAAHPELVDVNFGEGAAVTLRATTGDGLKKLRALGYVASSATPGKMQRDWTHMNSVAYNPELDQVMLSVYGFSEIWIIDHSTTTLQAAGHGGGRQGKGGDLLYRWGNPRAYRAGTSAQQRLANQHDAHWIPRGLPGEGHVLIFNNGCVRPGEAQPYSSVDEIELPVDHEGRYALAPGKLYGPDKPVWSYMAPVKAEFYAPVMSGAQRLANGNTLICWSTIGAILEVTAAGELVWRYGNPLGSGPAMANVLGDNAVADADSGGVYGVFLTAFEESKAGGMVHQSATGHGSAQSPDDPSPWGVASIFRAYRFAPIHPALAGRQLTPGKTIEESQAGQVNVN